MGNVFISDQHREYAWYFEAGDNVVKWKFFERQWKWCANKNKNDNKKKRWNREHLIGFNWINDETLIKIRCTWLQTHTRMKKGQIEKKNRWWNVVHWSVRSELPWETERVRIYSRLRLSPCTTINAYRASWAIQKPRHSQIHSTLSGWNSSNNLVVWENRFFILTNSVTVIHHANWIFTTVFLPSLMASPQKPIQ